MLRYMFLLPQLGFVVFSFYFFCIQQMRSFPLSHLPLSVSLLSWFCCFLSIFSAYSRWDLFLCHICLCQSVCCIGFVVSFLFFLHTADEIFSFVTFAFVGQYVVTHFIHSGAAAIAVTFAAIGLPVCTHVFHGSVTGWCFATTTFPTVRCNCWFWCLWFKDLALFSFLQILRMCTNSHCNQKKDI